MSHGTPSYELGQFAKLSSAVTLALPTALHGIDPKEAIKAINRNGERFALHTRKFFVPAEDSQKILRPRSIIHLPPISVNHDREWENAVADAGPNTEFDSDIHKVGDLYTPKRAGIVPTSITLANFGGVEDVDSEQVIEFGKEWNLGRIIDPRECFAIVKRFPKLHTSPGFFDQMIIVSLKDCNFEGRRHVCFVLFDGHKRKCRLDWFDRGWGVFSWFGFVREF